MPVRKDLKIDSSPDRIRSKLASDIASDNPVVTQPAMPDPAPVAVNDVPVAPKPRPTPRRTSKKKKTRSKPGGLEVVKRTLYTQDEVAGNAEVVARLSSAVGGKLTESAINRAFWSLLRAADDAMVASRKEAPDLSYRPSNGDMQATSDYEEKLGDYLVAILKRL